MTGKDLVIFKDRKRAIRTFMQDHYTDERLSQLLDHARAGKLAYRSCCCFIGIPTAGHELRGEHGNSAEYGHYLEAKRDLSGAAKAEHAFGSLWRTMSRRDWADARRAALIPMVKAEIRRRIKLTIESVELPETVLVGHER